MRNVPLVVVVVAVGIVVGHVVGGERGVVVVDVAGLVVVGEGGGRDLLEQLVGGRVRAAAAVAAAGAAAGAGTAHRAAGRGEARLVGGGRALLLPVELCLVNKRIRQVFDWNIHKVNKKNGLVFGKKG